MYGPPDFPKGPPYLLTPRQPTRGSDYPPPSPLRSPRTSGSVGPEGLPLATGVGVGARVVVLEYQPVVHRLRLSASA